MPIYHDTFKDYMRTLCEEMMKRTAQEKDTVDRLAQAIANRELKVRQKDWITGHSFISLQRNKRMRFMENGRLENTIRPCNRRLLNT